MTLQEMQERIDYHVEETKRRQHERYLREQEALKTPEPSESESESEVPPPEQTFPVVFDDSKDIQMYDQDFTQYTWNADI